MVRMTADGTDVEINNGGIVCQWEALRDLIQVYADEIGTSPSIPDIDYAIAQEVLRHHDGEILEHEAPEWEEGVVY